MVSDVIPKYKNIFFNFLKSSCMTNYKDFIFKVKTERNSISCTCYALFRHKVAYRAFEKENLRRMIL